MHAYGIVTFLLHYSEQLIGQQVEGSFEVKFLGGSDFIAQFKIAMDGTVTITFDPPSANGIQMDMHYRIAGNTVSINFDSNMQLTSKL